MLNFSPSCERNKNVILKQLTPLFSEGSQHSVLEIGSYSGQHAIHFCQHLNDILWQPTDTQLYYDALQQNLMPLSLPNCLPPKPLNVGNHQDWPEQAYDTVFTANTLHIMSWREVELMFQHLPRVCHSATQLVIYGPFKYSQQYTSESNAQFELWLKNRDIQSGIKDFEKINALAEKAGFALQDDVSMPANNQLLIWTSCR